MSSKYTLGQKLILAVASVIGPILILLYGMTWRVRWAGDEHLKRARENSGNVIYVFWHSRLLGLCYSHRYTNAGIMVSKSFDGEWITRVIRRLGYRVFRGSASKDGAPALIEMIRGENSGDLALTVDGPRGPAEKVKAGAVILASLSGLPLVPISIISNNAWRLKSWDRFMIPKPFSTIEVVRGEHIIIPENIDKDAIRRYSSELKRAIDGLG